MIDNSSMIAALAPILLKEGIVGDIEVGKPITRKMPCPKTTENKIDKTDKLYGGLTNDYRINPGLSDKNNPESYNDNMIANKIISIFVGNHAFTVNSIISYVQNAYPKFKANKISSVLKKLISSRQLVFNKLENKVYKNVNFSFEEDAEEDLKSSVLNIIRQNNGNLTITGIVKNLGPTVTRASVTPIIRELFNAGTIKSGTNPGHFYFNESIPLEKDGNSDEDEESGTMPVLDGETAETLKAKGWQETKPGTFIGPDGKQKYIVATEQTSKTQVNKNNMANKKYDFNLLMEESDDILADMRDDEMTAGLDEFDQDKDFAIDVNSGDDEYGDDPEEVTITLTRDQIDILQHVIDKAKSALGEGDEIDDMATDEEANAELMGDDEGDIDFESETETFEDGEDEEEDDDAFDGEEDEETLNGRVASIFDGTFSDGAPSFKRHSEVPKTGKRSPIEDRYSPSKGQVSDGARSDGGARMNRAGAAPKTGKSSGQPVKSKVSSRAGSNTPLFKL